MAYSKKTWKDRSVEYPTRRLLTDSNSNSEYYTVERAEGIVSEVGDAFNATNMNDLESRIESGIAEAVTTTTTTQATSDSSTKLASTAFVHNVVDSKVGASLTSSRAAIIDSSGKVASSSNITTTELDYLDGTTSNIQTQLNDKLNTSSLSTSTSTPDDDTYIITSANGGSTSTWYKRALSKLWSYIDSKITGAISNIITSNLTSSKVLVSDSSGKITTATMSSTKLDSLISYGTTDKTDGSSPLTTGTIYIYYQ